MPKYRVETVHIPFYPPDVKRTLEAWLEQVGKGDRLVGGLQVTSGVPSPTAIAVFEVNEQQQ